MFVSQSCHYSVFEHYTAVHSCDWLFDFQPDRLYSAHIIGLPQHELLLCYNIQSRSHHCEVSQRENPTSNTASSVSSPFLASLTTIILQHQVNNRQSMVSPRYPSPLVVHQTADGGSRSLKGGPQPINDHLLPLLQVRNSNKP